MRSVIVFGATGTIGRAVVKALSERGHRVIAALRSVGNGPAPPSEQFAALPGCEIAPIDITNEAAIVGYFAGHKVDAIISCLASRSGAPDDAWRIDHHAQARILKAAKQKDIEQFILLSAICVQRPKLAFQHAKLAFEKELRQSGLTYTIVRPTAFFKSLSGQVARVKAGKPFLVFGDGTLTACKPISDRDLAHFLVNCLDDQALQNAILPIGGPGAAITPRQQGEELFRLLGQEPRFSKVPVGLLDVIVGGLGFAGRIIPAAARKAELARIGRYYATESMLLWNGETGSYDAQATPSFGRDTLFAHYAQLVSGEAQSELREHAVF